LSGNALHAAQDEEAEALDILARTPSDSLGDIREKLKVLRGLMQKGRWFDGRDFQLLDSIPRDVRKDYASEVARIGAVICRQTKVLNSTEDAQARSMSIFEADEPLQGDMGISSLDWAPR